VPNDGFHHARDRPRDGQLALLALGRHRAPLPRRAACVRRARAARVRRGGGWLFVTSAGLEEREMKEGRHDDTLSLDIGRLDYIDVFLRG
jgi:hypothetical protein